MSVGIEWFAERGCCGGDRVDEVARGEGLPRSAAGAVDEVAASVVDALVAFGEPGADVVVERVAVVAAGPVWCVVRFHGVPFCWREPVSVGVAAWAGWFRLPAPRVLLGVYGVLMAAAGSAWVMWAVSP